jgi:chromosome segregation ATPase
VSEGKEGPRTEEESETNRLLHVLIERVDVMSAKQDAMQADIDKLVGGQKELSDQLQETEKRLGSGITQANQSIKDAEEEAQFQQNKSHKLEKTVWRLESRIRNLENSGT